MLIGRHTRLVCDALTRAVDNYLAGVSTFLDIAIPFRHGKSDIVSRALPAFFLGHCNDREPDVILSGYGAELVEGYSRDCKRIIRSDAYRAAFPQVQLAKFANNVGNWSIEGSTGKVTVSGLGGAVTGRGGDLIVIDDYCKNRAEALSEIYRRRTWESFRADIMSRRAPTTIVVVCATPWHTDDLHGRIQREMRINPDFPCFERMRFPARDAAGNLLFPERFSADWYREQYATLGKLASGLLDCEPTIEGGNRFRVENIKIHESAADFPQARYIRAWDLASSRKERDKDDPDWTVGELGAVTVENKVKHLWIRDAAFCQAEAPRRDALIQNTARADGAAGWPQYIEAFGGYKDAYTTLKSVLHGLAVVWPSHLPGDKSAKLAPLEPIFDAGNVHLLRSSWNEHFIRHFSEFPDGKHDDFCDPAAIIFHESTRQRGGLAIPGAL